MAFRTGILNQTNKKKQKTFLYIHIFVLIVSTHNAMRYSSLPAFEVFSGPLGVHIHILTTPEFISTKPTHWFLDGPEFTFLVSIRV